jgi:hypothetical protein
VAKNEEPFGAFDIREDMALADIRPSRCARRFKSSTASKPTQAP